MKGMITVAVLQKKGADIDRDKVTLGKRYYAKGIPRDSYKTFYFLDDVGGKRFSYWEESSWGTWVKHKIPVDTLDPESFNILQYEKITLETKEY